MSWRERLKLWAQDAKCKALFSWRKFGLQKRAPLWVFVGGDRGGSKDPTLPGEGCGWLTFWACRTVCAQLTF